MLCTKVVSLPGDFNNWATTAMTHGANGYTYTMTLSAGTYKFSVATGDLDSALWLSVGTLDADGEFVVVQEKLVSPGDLMNAINGVRLEAAETCYIRIST